MVHNSKAPYKRKRNGEDDDDLTDAKSRINNALIEMKEFSIAIKKSVTIERAVLKGIRTFQIKISKSRGWTSIVALD